MALPAGLVALWSSQRTATVPQRLRCPHPMLLCHPEVARFLSQGPPLLTLLGAESGSVRPHLTLFLCSESRPAPEATLPSELAFLSRFWKRSRAVRPRCELCLGTSSRPPKLSVPVVPS